MRETEDAVLQLVVHDQGTVEIVVPGEGRFLLDEEGLRACRDLAEEHLRPLEAAKPRPAADSGSGSRVVRSLVWLLGAVLIAVILGSFWALGRGVAYDEIVPVVERIESFVDEILEGTLGGLIGAGLAYLYLRRRRPSS